MRHSVLQKQQTARKIFTFCVVYFLAFAFCYVFLLQRDILAQTQYKLSDGTTLYRPLLSAVLCALLGTALSIFAFRMLRRLPLRAKAMAWFPSFLLIGLLGSAHFPELGDTASPYRWVWVLLSILAYMALLPFCSLLRYAPGKRESFTSCAWPNALLLTLFSLVSIAISNTDIVLHRTLQSARYLQACDYEAALQTARWEASPSKRLSSMTAFALSKTDQMGQSLFCYPQPYGSEGLLPLCSDTVMFYDLPRAVGHHIGYKRGNDITATRFLETIAPMPHARPSARQYLLCAYLLDKELDKFCTLLLTRDSLSLSLPRHYREALLLHQELNPETDILLEDSALNVAFQQFKAYLKEDVAKDERELKCRDRFGNTYWNYYYFN
ncbi:MAG: hypothetical protein J6Y39_07900 [Bacteroidaceae bacterium]|nr:hypothetical protein [Bacteroidaceae bacterium]